MIKILFNDLKLHLTNLTLKVNKNKSRSSSHNHEGRWE